MGDILQVTRSWPLIRAQIGPRKGSRRRRREPKMLKDLLAKHQVSKGNIAGTFLVRSALSCFVQQLTVLRQNHHVW